MKPNFALSLSFDGIRLIHRSGTGWTVVGDVALDSPDMAGELAMLRKTALALDPAGLRSKILIPNDQIKYLALDTTRATEDDVRAKLDGATPYAVSDLAYDFVRGGGRTYIAAVARETLDEAEAFAHEHRFGPVSFAGVPEEFTFVGEAFFGPTKASKNLLPPGETVERDSAAVKVQVKTARAAASKVKTPAEPTVERPVPVVTSPAASVPAPPLSESEATPVQAVAPTEVVAPPPMVPPAQDVTGESEPLVRVPEPVSEAIVEASTPAAVAVEPSPEPVVTAPLLAEMAKPQIDQPTEAPPAAPVVADEAPVFTSRARMQKAAKPQDLPGVTPPPQTPADEVATTRAEVAPEQEPAFVRRTHQTDVVTAGTASPVVPPLPPAAKAPDAAPAVRPVTAAPIVIPVKPIPAAAAVPKPILATPSTATGRVTIDTVGLAPRGVAAGPAKPGAAPAVTGIPAAGRQDQPLQAAPVAAPAIGTPKKPVLVDPSVSAAFVQPVVPPPSVTETQAKPKTKRQSRSAARAAVTRSSRSSSRFLGLILTAMLIVGMLAVAAWATMTDTVVSRWLGLRDDTPTVATADPVTVPISIANPGPDSTSPTIDLGDVALSEPAAVGPEQSAPDQSLPGQLATTEPLPEEAVADPATTATAVPGSGALPDVAENEVASQPAADPSSEVALDAAAAAAAAAAVAVAITELAEGDPATDEAAVTAEAITEGPPAASPSLGEPVVQSTGNAVTPEEAERFYAATGVWLRAPRLPLLPETEDLSELYTASVDNRIADPNVVALPALGADSGLAPQRNPPEPGTRLARDERGFILATPEGTLTPDGLLIFAGQPSLIPPTRPGTAAPPEAVAAVPESEAADEVDEAAAAEPAAVAPSVRPLARPESVSALADTAAEPDPATTEVDPALAADATLPAVDAEATAGAVSLAAFRPRERPESLEAPAPEAEAVVLAAFDGPRPSVRPDGLAPEGSTSSPETELAETAEPADPGTDVSAALAAIVEGAADPLANATPQAVAIARRPDSRPNNFGRVVEQQLARLERAQPPAAEEAVAAASTAGNLSREEQAETEPEVASNAAAAPSGPIPGGVASAATFENVMALREINLIGVYGSQSDRRALVRLANGRYLRVEVGDSLDGGQVAAISDSALNYVRRGRTITLEIPGE
jgi:hypothetical protein